MEWVSVRDWSKLQDLIEDWRELLAESVWPNPCFSPEFLLPLLEHRAGETDVSVYTARRGGKLVGLIPIARSSVYRLPIRAASVWRPDFSFDGTPLLHQRFAGEVFETFLGELSKQGTRLLSMDTASAGDEMSRVLESVRSRPEYSVFYRDSWERAALRPSGTADEYFQKQLSKNRRKKIRQNLKRLGQKGDLNCEVSQEGDDIVQWLHEFIELEASGWKGKQNSAIGAENSAQRFVEDLVNGLRGRQEVHFSKLTLDQRPIAMLLDISLGSRIYGYKTAYDESLAEYSPGALMEYENLKHLHTTQCHLFDGCSSPDNELINSFYADRLSFQNLVLGLSRSVAPVVNHVLPTLQTLANRIRRRS